MLNRIEIGAGLRNCHGVVKHIDWLLTEIYKKVDIIHGSTIFSAHVERKHSVL